METGTFYPDRYDIPVYLLLVFCKIHNWLAWSFFYLANYKRRQYLILPVTGYAHASNCQHSTIIIIDFVICFVWLLVELTWHIHCYRLIISYYIGLHYGAIVALLLEWFFAYKKWTGQPCNWKKYLSAALIDTSCDVKISAVCSSVSSQSTRVWRTNKQNYDPQDRASIDASHRKNKVPASFCCPYTKQ